MTLIKTSSQQSGQKIGIAVVVAAMVLFLLLTKIISLVTDWLWFQEVGYQTVFSVTLLAKFKTGAIFGVVFFLLLYINSRVALRLSEKPLFADPAGGFPLPFRELEPGALKILIFAGALLLAFFAALNGSTQSENLLLFLNAVPFGLADPLFEKDISFYVFKLPLLLYLQGWGSFVLIVTAAATGFIYLLRKSFLFIPPRIWRMSPAARTHLSLLAAIFFFWGIFGAWLDLNDLLFVKRGVVFGPG